jgi:hypothetical protein
MSRTVTCRSGLRGWQQKLQDNYGSLEEFVAYAGTYGIHTRLGYATPQEAWDANPTIRGSVDPDDLEVVTDRDVPRESVAKTIPTAGAMTAGQFSDWLTTRVDDWSHANGLAPHGEGEDLGDLFRHLEDMGAFEEIGVTVLADPIEQAFYFVGPDRSWVASTPYELGAEQETVWWDPVSHLRLDAGDAELSRVAENLRTRADEFARMASVTAGGAPADASPASPMHGVRGRETGGGQHDG